MLTTPDPADRPVWGWQVVDASAPDCSEFHTLPRMDVRTHIFDLNCACLPIEDVPGHIIHNAFDGRDAYEAGTRQYN